MLDPELESQKRRRKRITVTTIAVLAGLTLLFTLSGAPSEGARTLLATGLLWLCAFPTWRYFTLGERTIPYLPAMSALYFFSYGMPAFNRALRVKTYRPDSDTVDFTLLLALLGMALLQLAFYWSRYPKLLPRLRLNLDLANNRTKLAVLAIFTTALRALLIRTVVPQELAQLRNFVLFLPIVLLSALFLLFLRGQLARWQMAVALALAVIGLLLDFSTGAIAQPAFSLANLLFVYVAEKGKLPILALALITLLFLPALATKLEYRQIIAKGNVENTVDRLQIFGNLMGGVFTGERMSLREADEVAESRVDHLSAFTYVISKTPSVVPYWDGATYEDFLWSFVPRILAPNKPQKTLGQEYGHRYAFIARWDFGTSINLEQTVEMYANFGTLGVLIGMFLIGVIYRGLYTVLNHPGAGDGGILVAASTFRVLLNIESDFSLVFGGIVQNAVLLCLTLWLLVRRRGGAAAASEVQPA